MVHLIYRGHRSRAVFCNTLQHTLIRDSRVMMENKCHDGGYNLGSFDPDLTRYIPLVRPIESHPVLGAYNSHSHWILFICRRSSSPPPPLQRHRHQDSFIQQSLDPVTRQITLWHNHRIILQYLKLFHITAAWHPTKKRNL